MLCGVLCMGICMSVQGQETKKYPEPAPMQPEMSEFWTPQPKIVVPPDMDQAIITPPSDAIVLLGLDAESADASVRAVKISLVFIYLFVLCCSFFQPPAK